MATGYQIEDGKVKKLRSDFTPIEWDKASFKLLIKYLHNDCRIMAGRLDTIEHLIKRLQRVTHNPR